MTGAPSASERQAWRREHDKRGGGDVREYCSECLGDWPCPTIRLLDALESSEQREALLRRIWHLRKRLRLRSPTTFAEREVWNEINRALDARLKGGSDAG